MWLKLSNDTIINMNKVTDINKYCSYSEYYIRFGFDNGESKSIYYGKEMWRNDRKKWKELTEKGVFKKERDEEYEKVWNWLKNVKGIG